MIKATTKAFFSSEVTSLLDKYANTSDLLDMFLESTLEDLALPDLLPLFVGLELGSTLVDGKPDGSVLGAED